MAALHQVIQRVLLYGVRIDSPPRPTKPRPPPRLQPLIDAIAPMHDRYDQQAVTFGHRYRSAFWMIYLLSAIAVLFAVMPVALGWDDKRHFMHPMLFLWALGEVVIIFAVGLIYWTGHRKDWQGQWLVARTEAELTWYLPLIAPLVDFWREQRDANWYARVFDTAQSLHKDAIVEQLCVGHEALARRCLEGAWADAEFVADYARWTAEVLDEQQHYHAHVARRQRAILHRVHSINNKLFGITAIAALSHLVVHSLWLSVVTTFFPALGASLHGALAQSEAYRLAVTSERLVLELKRAIAQMRATPLAASERAITEIRNSAREAISVILEEHQDWYMLVQPHHLPLG
jgi:hypothetical protein